MKAFIIHTPHKKSIEYATKALESFDQFHNWEPELFGGTTLETLPTYEALFNINLKIPSRAQQYEKHPKFLIKKCCSLNHYRLFKKCLELNEPIAIIEHDSRCIGDWTDVQFDDVLILNALSALDQPILAPVLQQNKQFRNNPTKGIHDVRFTGLQYNLIDLALKGQYTMPGTGAYGITPLGASKMIAVYEQIGWDQSDFIINTGYVRIQTLIPELFTFKLPNLRTSHGENLS